MRFQTMAILQYARFKRLGYTEAEAKSLGLSFALFYAIMKYKRCCTKKKEGKQYNKTNNEFIAKETETNIFGLKVKYITDERGNKLFKIANKICDGTEWTKSILMKFSDVVLYNKAVEEANKLILQTEEEILKNNNKFFNKVYKPIRDIFIKNLEEKFDKSKKAVILENRRR